MIWYVTTVVLYLRASIAQMPHEPLHCIVPGYLTYDLYRLFTYYNTFELNPMQMNSRFNSSLNLLECQQLTAYSSRES